MTFSADEKAKAAAREVKYRTRVYPRLIEAGKLSAEKAAHEIAVMAEIARDYEVLAEKDRLI
jgi:hypothetical protein